MRRLREFAIRATAALIVLAVLVGPPLGIVALIGRPFPAWERVRTEFSAGRLTNDTTMRIAAAIGLVLWMWAVIVIATETRSVLAARHAGRAAAPSQLARAARRGALAALVRIALVGTVSTTATLSSIASSAWATTTSLHSAVTGPLPAAVVDQVHSASNPLPSAPTRTVTASGRDTPLSIAVALGDESLRDLIIDLNTGSEWSSGVFPAGMQVHVPAEATTPAQRDLTPAELNDEVVYVVEDGDTLWEITEDFYGTTSRAVVQQVADHNKIPDRNVIHEGDTIFLPASTALPAPTVNRADEATVRIVERGDTLTRIVADQYGTATDELVAHIAAVNHLADADLIFPGQQIGLPSLDDTASIDPATEDATAETVVEDAATELATGDEAPPGPPLGMPETSVPSTAPPEPEASNSGTTTSAGVPDTVPPISVAPTLAPATESTRPVAAPDAVPATSPAVTGPAVSSSADATSRRASVPLLAGISGAAVLASGMAVQVMRARRRRMTRGAHALWSERDETVDAIVAAADVPLVRWAGQQLAQLVAGLDRRSLTAGPLAVELSEASGIEVLWDAPQHAPTPPGWSTADGGWAWRLSYNPDAPTPPNDLPAGLPALVTIGTRDGRQLLVDLEAFGTIVVAGDPEHTGAIVRAIATELAAGDDLADAWVGVIGTNVGVDERLPRTTIHDRDRALARARSERDDIAEAVTGSPDTFRARAGSSIPIRATVLVGNDDPDIRAVATPRTGVAAVLAAETAPLDGAYIVIEGPERAVLQPLGITFVPAQLPAATADQITATLAQLAEQPAEPSDPPLDRYRTLEPPAANDASADAATDDPVDHDGHELVVRVLGVPDVPDRPGLGRRERILVSLLACRGGTLATSAVQDAIWGGRPIEPKTLWNVITLTRNGLGTFPDGAPALPTTDRSRNTLQLDKRVTTDLALLAGRLARARELSSSEAIPLLQSGLELIEGPPFDAAGYDWAHRDQDVAYAATVIEQAVELLVGYALDAGKIDIARDAIIRGLRGLPGDEVLYRSRMRVEHTAGNRRGITAAYDELCVYLADLDGEPTTVTTALYRELTRGSAD